MASPITGLQATNSGPTAIGDATTLTATIAGGSDVIFLWDLGNGAASSGSVVSVTYPATGLYTAVVTASNSIGAMTATTTITVVHPVFTNYLPIAIKAEG